MGITRSYQLFLLLLIIAISAAAYFFQLNNLETKAATLSSAYQQHFKSVSDWQESGDALYTNLNQEFKFSFFQYTNNLDGRLNVTEGKLIDDEQTLGHILFPVQVRHSASLPEARLLVILDLDEATTLATEELITILAILALVYIVLGLTFWLLSRSHRKGIRYAAEYIRNIPNFTFSALENSKLNGELKPITLALTECRTELKKKLDELTQENDKLTQIAFKDPVTGFATRQRFTQKLEAISKQTKEQMGVLINVKATELAQINQLHGKNSGDDYLIKMVSCMRKALQTHADADCYRVSSSDFSIFIPDISLKDSHDFAEKLKVLFDEYQAQIKADSIGYVGVAPYKSGSDPVQLLSLSETAVSIAQTLGPNSYHILEKLEDDALFGDDRWRLAIDDILKRQAIKFFQQPIQPCSREGKLYNELFSRFYNTEGKFLPTSTVIAMAERHGLVAELDKLVILSVVRMLENSKTLSGNFGINISTSSAHQESFVAWLKALLTKNQHISSRLIFEVNESGMQSNLNASYQFVRAVHSVGSRVSVEHFGMGFTSFKFFRQVRPDYIKLDGSYTEAIHEDIDNRFFIRMIIDIARRLDVKVIATSVEQQEEKLALEKLLIDGLQGYYITKPQAISDGSEKTSD